MKRNIFHIGFFHSASTLLQKHIFTNIKGYKFANYNKKLIDKYISYMPKNFGKYFFYENKIIFNEFKNYKKPFIYSSEAFSHLHEHNSFYKKKHRNENPLIGLLNLSKYLQINKDCDVLFIIRSQTSVIDSYFRRWKHLYKSENELFIDFPYKSNQHKSKRTLKFKNKYGMLYLNTFNYRKNLSTIFNIIDDKKRIHIIPYELLLFDKRLFLKKLGKVFHRNLDYLLPELEKKENKNEIKSKGLTSKFKLDLKKEFSDDNKILDRTFKLNLKKYNYY